MRGERAAARRTGASATLPDSTRSSDGGVELGQAAPVALRRRVEGHQVREAQLDACRREADDREVAAVAEQREGRRLAGRRARGLEDARAPGRDAVLLGEGRARALRSALASRPSASSVSVGAVRARARRAARRRRRWRRRARRSAAAIWTPKPPTPPTPTKTARSPAREAAARDRLVGRRDRVGDHRERRRGRARRVAPRVARGRAPGTGRAPARARGSRSRRARRCRGRSGCGQIEPRPARQAAHSPQGITAGTTTVAAEPASRRPRPPATTRAADLVAERERQRVRASARRRRRSRGRCGRRRSRRPRRAPRRPRALLARHGSLRFLRRRERPADDLHGILPGSSGDSGDFPPVRSGLRPPAAIRRSS